MNFLNVIFALFSRINMRHIIVSAVVVFFVWTVLKTGTSAINV